MIKLKIRQKLLFLLLIVALLPLSLLNIYWFKAAQTSLHNAAVNEQKVLATNAAYKVNQYIADKLNALIIHSQSPSVQSMEVTGAQKDLQSLINQDKDIQTLTLANSSGTVVAAMNRQTSLPAGASIKNDDAFRAATFLAGRQYVSPVSFNAQHHPILTITAPLVEFSSGQNLLSLSTAEPSQVRTVQQIKGVLSETVDLSSLWHAVLAQSTIGGGYAYVVDGQGYLIAYPNNAFQTAHASLSSTSAVQAFLKQPTAAPHPVELVSERGVPVLSSYQQVSETGWGVITEVPTATIFAMANHIALIGLLIFTAAILAIIALSYIVSRRVTVPIRRLADGAALISQGKLDTRIANTSTDEIGTLAKAFNVMALNLGLLLQRSKAEIKKADVILSNVSEGIVAIDADDKIVLANNAAAHLIGKESPELIGRQLPELYNWATDLKPFIPDLKIQQAYKDIVLTNSNHRINYLDVKVNPIVNDPTNIKAIITMVDNTKERELENMKVDFVSMSAHELRTPVTTIRGYLDLIAHDEGLEMSPNLRSYFEHMEASALQLVALINNLLNVSRIERNALTPTPDKVNWTGIVQQTVTDQQFMAKSKGITLQVEVPDEAVFILADPVTIQEVINNLIANALNYTNRDGHVTVYLETDDQHVITRVVDDGVGIAATSLPYLFTKFFRARSGLPSGSGGTGLGLYISKSIVEMYDGKISVESIEGEGSTFTITLPKFNEDSYNTIVQSQPNKARNNRYGWITPKSTTRRR